MVGPIGSGALHGLLNSLLPVGYVVARAALLGANGIGERAGVVCRESVGRAVCPEDRARTLPLFVLLFITALLSTFVWRKRWALVSAFVGLAALLGLQLEALAFVPLLAVAILLYRDAVSWRALLVGLSVFALLLAPYVVHDGLNGWENTRGLVAYAHGRWGNLFMGCLSVFLFALLGSGGIEGQAGPYHVQFRHQVPDLWWTNDALSVIAGKPIVWGLPGRSWAY